MPYNVEDERRQHNTSSGRSTLRKFARQTEAQAEAFTNGPNARRRNAANARAKKTAGLYTAKQLAEMANEYAAQNATAVAKYNTFGEKIVAE